MSAYEIHGDTVPTADREHFTPNVIVENPKHRRVLQYILSVAALLVTAAFAVDVSDDINLLPYTVPAAAVVMAVSGSLGLGVTIPNIPKR